jgi:hypothetical protein
VTARLIIQRLSGDEMRSVSDDGTVDGACPGCGCDPFAVQTEPAQSFDDRTLRAGSRCTRCGDPVGWVYVDKPTIFGAEEDRSMLVEGRPRVY